MSRVGNPQIGPGSGRPRSAPSVHAGERGKRARFGAAAAGVVIMLLGLGLTGPSQAQGPSPRLGPEYLVIRTIAGDIAIALYPDIAPTHVAQVLKLARLGIYDGVHFHRVHPGFVAQISDSGHRTQPLTKEQKAAIVPIDLELSAIQHRRGIVSMARRDDRNSARESFSIVLGDAPHLDGNYTAFGQVIAGMEVVDKMLQVPALPPRYSPITRISVSAVEVVSASEFDPQTLAPAQDITIPALDRGKLMVRQPLAQPMIIYGLIVVMLIGLLQFFLYSRLSPKKLRSIGLLSVLVCAFLLLMTLTPVALHQALSDEGSSIIGLFLILGLLAIIKLMGRFETPG